MSFSPAPLIGPWYQTAGGVWLVDSEYEFDKLVERLQDVDLAGVDTETQGCNPKVESPIGKARVVVWSMSWLDPALGLHPHTGRPLGNRVFISNFGEAEERGWIYKLKPWLEDPSKKKTGHNLFSYDLHVFANHGIQLNGIYCDGLRASRLHDVAAHEHDLKRWISGEPFHYMTHGSFTEVFKRPKALLFGQCQDCGKRSRFEDNQGVCPGKGKKACGGTLIREVSESQLELIPWEDILKDPELWRLIVDYATLDAKGSLELLPHLVDLLQKQKWKGDDTMWDYYQQRVNPYMYVVTSCERAGQYIDAAWCEEMSEKAAVDIAQLERDLVQWVGVDMNFGSWQQLQHLLYGEGPKLVTKGMTVPIVGRGFPIPPMARKDWKTQEQELPTDKDSLQWLADHVKGKKDKEGLKTLVKWRSAEGTKSKYLDKLPRFMDAQGFVHCQMAPDTETTRLSARNPPLHQIPDPDKDEMAERYLVREAFTVPDGWEFIGGDFSQLEPRILAHFMIVLFGDHSLAEDLATGDVYAATALRTWPWEFESGTDVKTVKKKYPQIRKKAKILVLSVNYGKTAYGLGNDLRDEDGNPIGKEKAQKELDAYFKAYPGVVRVQRWFVERALRTGSARSILGCYRRIPELRLDNQSSQNHGKRVAMNTPIQMTAANIAMMAQLRCNTDPRPDLVAAGFFNERLYQLGVVQTMQIHDELHFRRPQTTKADSEEAQNIIRYEMEHALELAVPIPVELKRGMTWREVK